MAVNKQAVLEALAHVPLPDGAVGASARDLASEIVIANGRVYFALQVPPERAEQMEATRAAAERAVAGLEGVDQARVSLTAERAATAAAAPAAPARTEPGIGQVRHIVAVASGKGGVGKSTTAVNLALAIAGDGHAVGILDADIYGPSVPRLLGLKGKPRQAGQRALLPMEAYGLKVMSMGVLVGEETPMVWRGPMVITALTQMLKEVVWGALDVLVVDMPPGTGDAQLTMAQQVPLAGAVIVSTPQDLALIDARKGIAMFQKVSVPILGLVENMSTFVCPHCGGTTDIFGHGGAEAEAGRLGVPFLGGIPLDMAIRSHSDDGTPIVVSEPDAPHAAAYRAIAAGVWAGLAGAGARGRSAPKIVIE